MAKNKESKEPAVQATTPSLAELLGGVVKEPGPEIATELISRGSVVEPEIKAPAPDVVEQLAQQEVVSPAPVPAAQPSQVKFSEQKATNVGVLPFSAEELAALDAEEERKKEQSARVEASIEEMAAAPKVPCASVMFRGEYFAKRRNTHSGKDKNEFEVIVRVPEALIVNEVDPIALFLREYANDMSVMRAKYEDYHSIRTCEVVGITALDSLHPSQVPLAWLDHARLVAHIRQKDYDIRTELYETAHKLRVAIKKYLKDPVIFKEQQAKRIQETSQSRKIGSLLNRVDKLVQ